MSWISDKRRVLWASTIAILVLASPAGCGGGEDTGDPGSLDAESALSAEEAAEPVEASPELEDIRSEANQILDGGLDGYEARIAELEGTPIVVNKWASWCLPCREEFPYFQTQAFERGDEVAFLGLLSNDGPETGATFLDRFPTPYPSYLDSDQDIASSLTIARGFPTTVFYGSDGKVVHTKVGPYESEDELAADIDRYAQ